MKMKLVGLMMGVLLSASAGAIESIKKDSSGSSEPCPVKHRDMCHSAKAALVNTGCAYQGQIYSEGALLKMEGQLHQCQREGGVVSIKPGKEGGSNSKLIWIKMKDFTLGDNKVKNS